MLSDIKKFKENSIKYIHELFNELLNPSEVHIYNMSKEDNSFEYTIAIFIDDNKIDNYVINLTNLFKPIYHMLNNLHTIKYGDSKIHFPGLDEFKESIRLFITTIIKDIKFRRNKTNNKTIIISGFPGVGKSTLVKNNKQYRILDLDSNNYEDFYDYIEDAKKAYHSKLYDFILVSTHEDVRILLKESDLDYLCIVPDRNSKLDYIKNYINRGDNEIFVQRIMESWHQYLDTFDSINTIILGKGTYLPDIIDDIYNYFFYEMPQL